MERKQDRNILCAGMVERVRQRFLPYAKQISVELRRQVVRLAFDLHLYPSGRPGSNILGKTSQRAGKVLDVEYFRVQRHHGSPRFGKTFGRQAPCPLDMFARALWGRVQNGSGSIELNSDSGEALGEGIVNFLRDAIPLLQD